MNLKSKIIAIDFDGTIVEDRFPEIGNLMPGALETINGLHDQGAQIIIWTSRSGVELARAVEFLARSGIKYDRVNESCPDNVKRYGGRDTRKIFADVYVDDKGLVPLPDWAEIKEMIYDKITSK